MESSTLRLNCTVSGLPLPQITWWMTGQDGIQEMLTTDDYTMVEEEVSQNTVGQVSSRLVIQTVNSSHAGLYECVAVNSLGSDLTQATVTVYGEVL